MRPHRNSTTPLSLAALVYYIPDVRSAEDSAFDTKRASRTHAKPSRRWSSSQDGHGGITGPGAGTWGCVCRSMRPLSRASLNISAPCQWFGESAWLTFARDPLNAPHGPKPDEWPSADETSQYSFLASSRWPPPNVLCMFSLRPRTIGAARFVGPLAT